MLYSTIRPESNSMTLNREREGQRVKVKVKREVEHSEHKLSNNFVHFPQKFAEEILRTIQSSPLNCHTVLTCSVHWTVDWWISVVRICGESGTH